MVLLWFAMAVVGLVGKGVESRVEAELNFACGSFFFLHLLTSILILRIEYVCIASLERKRQKKKW